MRDGEARLNYMVEQSGRVLCAMVTEIIDNTGAVLAGRDVALQATDLRFRVGAAA